MVYLQPSSSFYIKQAHPMSVLSSAALRFCSFFGTPLRVGSKYHPHPLPDPKTRPPSVDIISLYPEAIQERMNDEIKEAIRKTYLMKATMQKSDTGHYSICSNKQERAPYDRFLAQLCQQYGTDPLFRDGARLFDAQLLREMLPYREYLFGLSGQQLEHSTLRILPRNEVLTIDNQYYQGRHTHTEFLTPSQTSLLAAGTIMVDHFQMPKFNFRTGHFMVHMDDPKALIHLRSILLQRLTLTTNLSNLHFQFQLWSALSYEDFKDKPAHSVINEIILDPSKSPNSMDSALFTATY